MYGKAKSISVTVLTERNGYDCTNGGVTSKHKSFTLYADSIAYETDEHKHPDYSLIVVRRTIGEIGEYVHCVPAVPGEGVGPMAGGNFVHTSDSRYREVTGISYPIAVHDRWESAELNDRLSR